MEKAINQLRRSETGRRNVSGRRPTQASSFLWGRPCATEESWYKSIQSIYLDFLQNQGSYELTSGDAVFLQTVAETAYSTSTSARSLLCLLTGEWVEPLQMEDAAPEFPSGKLAKTRTGAAGFFQPNPANESVTLFGQSGDGQFHLLSITGELLIARMANPESSTTISLAHLPAGLYFLKEIGSEDHLIQAGRLFVQH